MIAEWLRESFASMDDMIIPNRAPSDSIPCIASASWFVIGRVSVLFETRKAQNRNIAVAQWLSTLTGHGL